jgi:ubiquinone/menaquinone biosynthesis C-methylase UbiE
MDHGDHVNLLRGGIPGPGGVWADFGSGGGAFTLALADLLGPDATIHSVDRDGHALAEQQHALRRHFPATSVAWHHADYTQPLDLPELDGVVLANTLHFVPDRDKPAALRLIASYLRPGGRLIVVEYNIDRGDFWVPHPFSYRTWQALATRAGLRDTRLIGRRPSRFRREIYSAVSVRPGS